MFGQLYFISVECKFNHVICNIGSLMVSMGANMWVATAFGGSGGLDPSTGSG